MSGGKTAKSAAFGGVGVICLEVALQLSGFQSPAVAVILVIIACVLFVPLINEKRKVAWSAGRRLYATYGASRQRQSMIIVILIGAVIGGGGLGLVWWAFQSAHANRPMLDAPDSVTTEKAPSAVTHQITSSPLEIMRAINSAGALQKEDVAAAYLNGAIEWQLYFFYVKPVRGDAARIEAVFSSTINHPPDGPLIICAIPRKGNEYLGVLKGAPGFAIMFRVKALIADIDYEHNQIKLGNTLLEQLPSIETAVVTPSPSPTALRPSPPREKGPKSNIPNAEIYSLFSKGDTSMKVSKNLAPYVGTVMEIEGKLIQASGSGRSSIVVTMFVDDGPGAICVFDNQWTGQLDALSRDQKIRVRGKIKPDQPGNDLFLEECELLESVVPPPAREEGPKNVPPNPPSPRVTYEETDKIIEIFKNAPQVKVAVTSLSVQAGEEFRPVMERAGWLCEALKKAGVNAAITAWGSLGSVPDGTSIWWIRNHQNNDMVERIIRAAKIKGLHPRPVTRPVSAGECEIELMIGRNPTRPS